MSETLHPKAVLFDCDGVLVDTEALCFDILAEDLPRYGLDLGRKKLEELFLGSTIRSLYTTANAQGAQLPDTWIDSFYDRLYARMREGVPMVAGIEPFLDQVQAAGMKIAVGSNGTHEKMGISLGQYPTLQARFEGHFYSGQALGAPKPAPDLWLHAAAQLGVAPQDCVVIDDSPAGCTGALRAGMHCFGFAAHSHSAPLEALGVEVVHSFAEIAKRIGLS